MSGLAAVVGGSQSRRRALLADMLEAGSHRGREGVGVWQGDGISVGHLLNATLPEDRLGPIDDGHSVIALDGFISNRFDLLPSSDDTDASVVSCLYRAEPNDFVKRLRGEFAFILVDQQNNTILAARDHFGMRPLYWAKLDCLLIASEPGMLLSAGVPSGLDKEWIPLGIAGGTASLDATPLRRVRAVPPRHVLSWDSPDRGPNRQMYFSFTSQRPVSQPKSKEEAAEVLGELLDTSCARALRANGRVGISLSGGVDSAVIATTARRNGLASGSPAFTAVFPGLECDESEVASSVAADLGLRWCPIAVYGLSPLRDSINLFSSAGPSLMPNRFVHDAIVNSAARADVRVLLDGHDADSLIAVGPYDVELLRRGKIMRAFNVRRESDRKSKSVARSVVGRFLRFSSSPFIASIYRTRAIRGLPPWARRSADTTLRQRRIRWRTSREWLAHNLDSSLFAEQFAVQNIGEQLRGVESRHPYMDVDIASFLINLDPAMKIEAELVEGNKALLRLAAGTWLPSVIHDKKAKSNMYPAFASALSEEYSDVIVAASRFCVSHPESFGPIMSDPRRAVLEDLTLWRGAVLAHWEKELIDDPRE